MTQPHNLSSTNNWNKFKREDDGVVFAMSVLNISAGDMKLILDCEDMGNPADMKQARAVAHAHMYAGKKFPKGLYKAIDGKIPEPNRRRFYSPQPIHERRDPVINYAAERDKERDLIDKEGSLSHYRDRADDRNLAKYMDIPLSGTVDPPPDPYEAQDRINELENELEEAKRQRRQYRNKSIQLKKDLNNANDLVDAKDEVIDGKNEQIKTLKDRIALLESANHPPPVNNHGPSRANGSPPVRQPPDSPNVATTDTHVNDDRHPR